MIRNLTIEPAGARLRAVAASLLGLPITGDTRAWLARTRGRFVGAVLLARKDRTGSFWASVLASHQRRGVATLLARTVEEEARDEGLQRLETVRAVSSEGAEAFLTSQEFCVSRTARSFEADAGVALDFLKPYYEWLIEREVIPDDIELRLIEEAPAEDVARLISKELGGDAEALLRRLKRGGRTGFNTGHVIMQAGRVIGASLGRYRGRTLIYEARAVDPAYRFGWANLVLLYAGAHDAVGRADRLRFMAHDEHGDTLRVAQKIKARLLHCSKSYAKDLGPRGNGDG